MPKEELFKVEQDVDAAVKKVVRALTENSVLLGRSIGVFEEKIKALKQLKKVRDNEIIRALTNLNVKSMEWDDGVMVICSRSKYPGVPGEHSEKFKQWLIKNGYWKLAKIHPSTLRSILRERLEKKMQVPSYVTVFEEDAVSVRNKKRIKPAAVDKGSQK